MAVGVIVSGGIVAGLAVISPELAVMALAFMGLGTFLFKDREQRKLWEQSTNAKLGTMNESHERLSKEVARQRYDLIMLRDDVKEKAEKPASFPSAQKNIPRDAAPRAPLDVNPAPRVVAAGRRNKSFNRFLSNKNEEREAALAAKPDPMGFSDNVVTELVQSAVRNKRIDVFVQPIMRLPQRKTRYYEVFARIRAKPGQYLPASRYMALAQKHQLMNEIDQLLLMQCLKTIRDTATLDRAVPFFINVTTSTLGNMSFMKQLLQFLARNRELAPRLVFEIRQKDFDEMSPAMLEILRGLGRLDCALSLDHVTNLEVDLKFLQVLKVRFIKVHAKALLKKTKSDRDFIEIERQKRKIEANGIGFIVERIENEAELKELLDFNINYGQGYLFGKPDLQGAYSKQGSGAA